MSLNDEKFVEAHALLSKVMEDVGDQFAASEPVMAAAIEWWLEFNHPERETRLAALGVIELTTDGLDAYAIEQEHVGESRLTDDELYRLMGIGGVGDAA